MKTKATASIFLTLFLLSILSSAFITPLVAASPNGSLVGLWHFDEGMGSTASDSSGNGNDGTLSGGKFGNALSFDGVGDYVEVPDSSSLDITGSITLEAWIYRTKSNNWQGIISKFQGEINQRSYLLYLDTTNKLRMFVSDDGTQASREWVDSTEIVPLNEWTHVAGTFDGSDLKLYINGEDKTGVVQDDVSSIHSGTAPVIIGDFTQPGPTHYYFGGIIDEVRISNVARTSFYLAGPHDPTWPGTVAIWHFDESIGTTVYDGTANDNDGTINGASWAGPTWTTGYFDAALEFDGYDDGVLVMDSSTLDFTEKITVEAWVYLHAYVNQRGHYIQTVMEKNKAYYLNIQSGKLSFYWYGLTNPGYHKSTNILPLNTWIHIAATYDGSNVKLYENGEEVNAIPASQEGDTSDWYLGIGYEPYKPSTYPRYFDGIIDEARIYTEALDGNWIKLHSMGCYGGGFDSVLSDSVVAVGSSSQLAVRVLDAYGNGLEGVTVNFLDVDPGTLTSIPSADTGSNGLAISTTGAVSAEDIYEIEASIGGAFFDNWILVAFPLGSGFVTGGGWIMSPEGAYVADLQLAGKANFGFVSKYKKGANVPDGQTEFKFEVADFEFHSSSYDWLVVAGGSGRAQFKGSGTVNDAGDYGFILTAIDGKLSSSDEDMFRIKIWDKTTGDIVYDNKMGAPDSDNPDTTIGGGSIVIHKK